MILSQVRELSEGKEWSYEAKRDGYLCLAGKNGGVTLWSHRGTLFTARLPEVARACEKLPLETVVDGEVVADTTNAVRLQESTYPPVYYIPRDDVRMERHERLLLRSG